MAIEYDQLKREVRIPAYPERIISLVPSITELLCDLGLEARIAGITKFCIHPESNFRSKPRIGGTKKIHFDKIRALNPDLIIANKEENNKSDVGLLAREFPVWVSDVSGLEDALDMILKIGTITATETRATSLAGQIRENFSSIQKHPSRSAVYLIWKDPLMAAGSHTFINTMMQYAGYNNALVAENRYPEISMDTLKQLNPETLLLASEPYPFGEKHLKLFESHLPQTECVLADGEYFSWYGSRLLQAPAYFESLRTTQNQHGE